MTSVTALHTERSCVCVVQKQIPNTGFSTCFPLDVLAIQVPEFFGPFEGVASLAPLLGHALL